MICSIADLMVEIPAAGGMDSRCKEYLSDKKTGADIIIRAEDYCAEFYSPSTSREDVAYMESGRLFCWQLLAHGGLYLHAAAVELDGRAYLFSGDCGVGKSTHARLWKEVFGERARIINGDKPALRYLNGEWFAYGTPWCGKEGINENRKAPLAGICFLKQSDHEQIRRLDSREALSRIFQQTMYRLYGINDMDRLLQQLDLLLRKIPVYELENRPIKNAAKVSYEAMSCATEEI